MNNRIVLILSIAATMLLPLRAQKTVIKPGETIYDHFKREKMYVFPAFEQGTVIFRDGTAATAPMNYNVFHGQMLFIQPPGDTLAIANPTMIKIIVFKSDTFYYSAGYHQVMDEGFGKMLTRKQFIKYDDVRKGGAYGTTSSLAATTTMSSYAGNPHQTTQLVVNQEVEVSRKKEFFIYDHKKFRLLNKVTVKKMYPRHKEIIYQFIEKENIDFTNDDDMVKLFRFLNRCI